MKLIRFFILILHILFLIINDTCHAQLMMFLPDKPPQISKDGGISWESLSLGIDVDGIDFFNAHLAKTGVFYIVGYDKHAGEIVAFRSYKGAAFKKERVALLDMQDTDHFEYLKLKQDLYYVNVFGRISGEFSSATYGTSVRKRNILYSKNRQDIAQPYTDQTWYPTQLNFGSMQFNQHTTILDIFVCPTGKDGAGHPFHYYHVVTDPKADSTSGKYPFISSALATNHMLRSETSTVYVRDDTTDYTEKMFEAGLMNGKDLRFPIGFKNEASDSVAVFGGNSRSVYGALSDPTLNYHASHDEPFQTNDNYSEFGTMLFADNHSKDVKYLFFLTEKNNGSSTDTTAVLAYGTDIHSLKTVVRLDESLNIKGLTKQTGTDALTRNEFYRFVQEKGRYLFFLSAAQETQTPISVVLESSDGITWKHINNVFIPQNVREIIALPEEHELTGLQDEAYTALHAYYQLPRILMPSTSATRVPSAVDNIYNGISYLSYRFSQLCCGN